MNWALATEPKNNNNGFLIPQMTLGVLKNKRKVGGIIKKYCVTHFNCNEKS
jgi:hypothetical protein